MPPLFAAAIAAARSCLEIKLIIEIATRLLNDAWCSFLINLNLRLDSQISLVRRFGPYTGDAFLQSLTIKRSRSPRTGLVKIEFCGSTCIIARCWVCEIEIWQLSETEHARSIILYGSALKGPCMLHVEVSIRIF